MLNNNDLIGLSEEEAISKLENEKIRYRIVSRDHKPFVLTYDYAPKRVNLAIVDNKVIAIGNG